MRTVEFFFDYLSPYAYLAALEIPDVCKRHGVGLRLQPVLFAGLLDHWGQRGPAEIPPKGRHVFRECARYARLRNTPFRSPRFHPFNPVTALRVSLAEVSGADQPLVVRTLFQLGWARGGDLGDADEITAALDAAGLAGSELVARTREPAIKQVLRSATEAAVARDVFGIPTMLVDEELFWGLDQLEYLELYLEGRDPIADVDWQSLMSKGRAAWRRGVSDRS